MTVEPPLYIEVLTFWREAGSTRWFRKDDDFDRTIRDRYEAVHFAASRGEYADWIDTAEGALALVILLDQFPRNLYRGSAHAFATDPLARTAARIAVERGHDQAIQPPLRLFFYMPFEHSEQTEDQVRAVDLISAVGDEGYTRFAVLHRNIIARFGRFPHRNACLGRTSTPEELAFLAEGGFSG